MSEVPLYLNWTSRTFTSSDGGNVEGLNLIVGDKPRFTMVPVADDGGTVRALTDVYIRSLRCSVGQVYAAPISGQFAFRYGTSVGSSTEIATALDIDSSADVVKASVPASAISAVEIPVDVDGAPIVACWLIRLADPTKSLFAPAENSTIGNTLSPDSFIRVRQITRRGGQIWWELRLIQSPYAFTSQFERVLATAPFITEPRSGILPSPGDGGRNEIQSLNVPNGFVGTYYLKWSGLSTAILSTSVDGPDQIAAALNAMYNDGKTRFNVTNPVSNQAYIEFVGELGAQPQALMTVHIDTFNPGTINFTLDLSVSECNEALRGILLLEDIPFEIELEVMDSQADLDDGTIAGRRVTYQQTCTLAREQIYDELIEVPAIDFAKPPQPKDYVPFTLDQIITGEQFFVASKGNGVLRIFPLNHMLGTDMIANIVVRENKTDGRILALGQDSSHGDYFAVADDENSVTVTINASYPVPPINSLVMILTMAGPKAAFQAHTHEIEQINGLDDIIDDLTARVTRIENAIGVNTISGTAAQFGSSTTPMAWDLPVFSEVYPLLRSTPQPKLLTFQGFDPTTLGRPGGLFPALISAAPADLPVPIPPPASSTIGVYHNVSGVPKAISGGLKHRSSTVPVDGYAAFDGRVWYVVEPFNGGKTYYSTDFDRTLWAISVNDQQFRVGTTLDVEFGIQLAILGANTTAQWVMTIEVGVFTQDTSPSGVTQHLKNVVWNTTPLVSQVIELTAIQATHLFGVRMTRQMMTVDDVLTNLITASGVKYGGLVGADADAVPSTANFALRARLSQFDTEDSVSDPRGFVGIIGLAPTTTADVSNTLGRAVITTTLI